MSPDELLDVNIARFAREASPTNLVRVLVVLGDELRRRGLDGWCEVARAAQLLHDSTVRPPLGNPIPLTFRPGDVRPRA